MRGFEKQFPLPELVNSGVFENDRFVNFHSHPGTEIVLLTRGRCKMEVDGETLEGGNGTLFILPAGKEHSQTNEGVVRTIYLSFQCGVFFDESPRVIDIKGDRWIKTWMNHVYWLHHRTQDDFSGLIPGILYSILKRIVQIESGNKGGKPYHPALSLTLEYIDGHLDKTVSIGDMAEYSGVSTSYLCAIFKRQFGKGPVTVALESKMKYAERLLREPYLSIKETALACGFCDPNYFSRFFRKIHGCSPGEYRKTPHQRKPVN